MENVVSEIGSSKQESVSGVEIVSTVSGVEIVSTVKQPRREKDREKNRSIVRRTERKSGQFVHPICTTNVASVPN